MNAELFIKTYKESRNGANEFFRHPLVRNFVLSDGVHDCAACGIWWLIDIAATEIPTLLAVEDESLGSFKAVVANSKARLTCSGSGDRVLWSRAIDWTDMPDGIWTFFIADENERRVMILPTEY